MRTYGQHLFTVVLLFFLTYTFSFVAQDTSVEDMNRDLFLTYAQAELNRDYNLFDDLLTEDFVRYGSSAFAPVVNNREEFKAFLQETAAMFPDYVNTVEMMVVDKDLIAVSVAFKGTFVGNGEVVEFPFMAFWTIEDGRLSQLRVEWNDLVMLPQMGMLPPVEELLAPEAEPLDLCSEAEVVMALGAALNAGDVDTAMSYIADNAYFGTVDMESNHYSGKEAIRSLFENLVADQFRIEQTIVATYNDDHILVSDTKTWANEMMTMGLAPFTATEVYVVKDNLITGITWVMTNATRERIMSAIAPSPIMKEDVIGTWKLLYGGFYMQFNEDGTYRADETIEGLNSDTPQDIGMYTVENSTITQVSGAETRNCVQGDTGIYAMSVGVNDMLEFTLQSDECEQRRAPAGRPHPFFEVEDKP